MRYFLANDGDNYPCLWVERYDGDPAPKCLLEATNTDPALWILAASAPAVENRLG